MMDNIIRLHTDQHYEIQLLLPWYATGRLDAAERAKVEAHLVACPDCLAELRLERRLEAEVGDLPVDVEHAWAAMVQRLDRAPRRRAPDLRAVLATAAHRSAEALRGGAPWLGWATAAAAGLVLVAGPMLRPPAQAPYHALASAAAPAAGNVIVIFRPDATEQAMRQALREAGASLVGGPTAADAYVLRAPGARRASALASLRSQKAVILAEPIDPDGPS
jgi:hypothetical protein